VKHLPTKPVALNIYSYTICHAATMAASGLHPELRLVGVTGY